MPELDSGSISYMNSQAEQSIAQKQRHTGAGLEPAHKPGRLLTSADPNNMSGQADHQQRLSGLSPVHSSIR